MVRKGVIARRCVTVGDGRGKGVEERRYLCGTINNYQCTMTNELIITEVPNTMENEFPVLELTSLLLCCIGIGVVLYVKRKK